MVNKLEKNSDFVGIITEPSKEGHQGYLGVRTFSEVRCSCVRFCYLYTMNDLRVSNFHWTANVLTCTANTLGRDGEGL